MLSSQEYSESSSQRRLSKSDQSAEEGEATDVDEREFISSDEERKASRHKKKKSSRSRRPSSPPFRVPNRRKSHKEALPQLDIISLLNSRDLEASYESRRRRSREEVSQYQPRRDAQPDSSRSKVSVHARLGNKRVSPPRRQERAKRRRSPLSREYEVTSSTDVIKRPARGPRTPPRSDRAPSVEARPRPRRPVTPEGSPLPESPRRRIYRRNNQKEESLEDLYTRHVPHRASPRRPRPMPHRHEPEPRRRSPRR
ncbi:hypothetical protein Ciccas_012659 [Cichlidogyrus casuarinus]|uniref:Uncharacterized protein n=1 Tax=Cichlidogyrus casuarinus TaxID=1844966 RepID=A0ABD2PMS7_9PLAT